MGDKPLDLSGNPNLDKLIKEAERLGCTVSIPRRSGEFRIAHARLPKPVNINSRRKDGARALVVMLRHLQNQNGSRP
jgi:hypothetical protein